MAKNEKVWSGVCRFSAPILKNGKSRSIMQTKKNVWESVEDKLVKNKFEPTRLKKTAWAIRRYNVWVPYIFKSRMLSCHYNITKTLSILIDQINIFYLSGHEKLILIHFIPWFTKLKLELTQKSKFFTNITLAKYDNKNLSFWLANADLLNIYLTFLWFVCFLGPKEYARIYLEVIF